MVRQIFNTPDGETRGSQRLGHFDGTDGNMDIKSKRIGKKKGQKKNMSPQMPNHDFIGRRHTHGEVCTLCTITYECFDGLRN